MISVIIAAYNYGKYLAEAFKSLQNQTYADWECIVIDDGSQDNTKEVVSEWIEKDQRIKYYLQKNAGPSAARNKGLEKATGSYILFLDADDILEKNKLKSHLEVLDNDPTIDVAYGDVRYFNDLSKNEYFYSLKEENKPWIPHFRGPGNKLIDTILKQNIMVTSSPLLKKDIFKKTGLFDPKLLKLEDWEFFQRLALNNLYFYYVDDPDSLVLMRAHSTSYSYDKRGMRSYYLPILEKHILKSRLSFKNYIYITARILEEYTDTTLHFVISRSYPPLHYKKLYSYIFPVLLILLFPIYLIIKILRLMKFRY